MKIYTNELSHITNMAALPIYGKKIFSRTTRLKMFAFGLYTQVSDSGPHGPLVYINKSTACGCQRTTASVLENSKSKKGHNYVKKC